VLLRTGLVCLTFGVIGAVIATILGTSSSTGVLFSGASTILAVGAIAAFAKWWPLATADVLAGGVNRARFRLAASVLMLGTILVWLWALLLLLNASPG
ncbi:MAG: hypothetical protein WAW85_06820, partial [Gordonia sp. (in: high G+C Gram-positive bacteria)]|uniref:hypothetical protein n=1 Tax=Gordonia sp. (in: high G+C Gram-positive bacteria) TaxID=84139 RepID=UPI003BB4D9FC